MKVKVILVYILGKNLCLNLVASLLGSLKVLFWVHSSFLCTQSHWALLFNHMFVPTTVMQMPLNLLCLFPGLKPRWHHESQRVWLISLSGWLQSSTLTRPEGRKESPVHDLSIIMRTLQCPQLELQGTCASEWLFLQTAVWHSYAKGGVKFMYASWRDRCIYNFSKSGKNESLASNLISISLECFLDAFTCSFLEMR